MVKIRRISQRINRAIPAPSDPDDTVVMSLAELQAALDVDAACAARDAAVHVRPTVQIQAVKAPV